MGAYRALKFRVVRHLEKDVGPYRKPRGVMVSRITPRRLVKLVEYLGDRVSCLWTSIDFDNRSLLMKLNQCLDDPLSAEAARRVLACRPK